MPAGFTADSLPIGVELMGRPLADARLVAFASDYEQATHPRRPPQTTPPLMKGRAPVFPKFTASASANGVTIRGTFQTDVALRTLEYSVQVSGVRAEKIYAISFDRDSAGVRPAMLYRLSGVGVAKTTGRVKLGQTERAQLAKGFMHVKVYTEGQMAGAAKATLVIPAHR